MILATYQIYDYRTEKDNRYGNIKKMLGIPEDKNIYWCIPANSMEQFLIGNVCIKPFNTFRLVIFETEDYRVIDGIKWDYMSDKVCEGYSEVEADDSILKLDYPDKAKYIVTDIPEDVFEVDANFSNILESFGYGLYPDRVMDALMQCKDEFLGTLESEIFLSVAEDAMDHLEFDIHCMSTENRKKFEKIFRAYMLFVAYFASKMYSAAMYYLGYEFEDIDVRVPASLDELIYLFHAGYCDDDCLLVGSYAEDYRRAITDVYRFLFDPFGEKKNKDGGKMDTPDIIEIMSQTAPVYRKSE